MKTHRSILHAGKFCLTGLCIGIAGAIALAQAAAGASTTVTLAPTADTRVFNADWGWNNNAGATDTMGVYQGRDRSFVQFDLSGIPAGNTILSATLTIYARTTWGSNPDGNPIEIYRLTKPWTELGTTWNTTDGSTPWTSAGGDAVGAAGTQLANPYAISTQNPGEGQPVTWSVATLVSEWLAGSSPNYGFLLALGGTRTAALHLYTREYTDPALRPTLTVEYTSETVPPAITTQPQRQDAVIGGTVTFNATASGTLPLYYQWFKNGTGALADQTNSVLTLPNVALADAGLYSVLVTNAAGSTNSSEALLKVFVWNAARAGVASQSTTDNGGVASRAIDGNTDGNWGAGSVTHTGNNPIDNEWWEVNLGEPMPIEQIRPWFRTDCCQQRAENLRIVIYDTADPGTRQAIWMQDVGTSPGATKAFDVVPTVVGQVVRIEHIPGTNLVLSLAEVQVFTGDTTTAPPVVQSVSWQGGRSLSMIVHFDKFVDLTTAQDLANYVLASGGPPTSAARLGDSKSVLLAGVSLSIGESYSLTVSGVKDATGRPMAEQTVTGTVSFYSINWALSGTASQSSVANGGEASRAIDGNNSGQWGSGTITHSADPASEPQRYWEVDLGDMKPIGAVNIWFRTDCCTERNANFTLLVLDDARAEVVRQTYPGQPGGNVLYAYPAALLGRYVRFEPGSVPTTTPFSLSEVEVMAPYTGASITVTQSPGNVTVPENAEPVFGPVGAVAVNAPQASLQVQWQKGDGLGGFTNIPGATALSYTNPPVTFANDGEQLRALFVLPGVSVASGVATLAVNNDVFPPVVQSVTYDGGPGGLCFIVVHFDELMEPGRLGDSANYSCQNGPTVDNAVVGADGKSVTLTVNGLADQLGIYMLRIDGLADLVGNPIDPVTISGTFPKVIGSQNMALAGTATQSSVAWEGTPQRAIDGNVNGNWGGGSITHTQEPAVDNEWWEVDLHGTNLIGTVHLWFRTDCCQQRDDDLRVVIYDSADLGTRKAVWMQSVGTNPGDNKAIIMNPPTEGQVVRVEHPPGVTNIVSLAEVQVFPAYGVFPPLNLSVIREGGNITVSWPASVNMMVLESATEFPATAWTPVPGVVNNSVTLTGVTANMFFRLRSP